MNEDKLIAQSVRPTSLKSLISGLPFCETFQRFLRQHIRCETR
jgi:hypothetical protein